MRSTTIRNTAFGTIFILPLLLPQSRHSDENGSIFFASKASADGTINRLMRWTGYGWSCGYHACNNHGWGLRDGLPPVGNTAAQRNQAGYGTFELIDPAHPIMHSGLHEARGHHYTTTMHPNRVEGLPIVSAPIGAVPMSDVGQSLVAPQPQQQFETIQPYRSAIPTKAIEKKESQLEDSEDASPSDLELLPSPKGDAEKTDELDDLLLEDSSVRLIQPRNRSARVPAVTKPR
jgi:hypothetical protein